MNKVIPFKKNITVLAAVFLFLFICLLGPSVEAAVMDEAAADSQGLVSSMHNNPGGNSDRKEIASSGRKQGSESGTENTTVRELPESGAVSVPVKEISEPRKEIASGKEMLDPTETFTNEQDLQVYLNGTSGQVYDTFTLASDSISIGVLALITADEAAEFYCIYDAAYSGREQVVYQITITEYAKGQYRLGDLTMDDSKSQLEEKLAAKGFRKYDESLIEDAYFSEYMNSDQDIVYIIHADLNDNVIGLIARNPVSQDIEMYNS